MKLIALILLIKWLSTTTEAQICPYPIVLDTKVPGTIDFVKEGFGKGFRGLYKKIIIVGKPTNKTDQFAINLAEDGELFKTADVSLHLNARFNEKVVVLNNWLKPKGWGTEQNFGRFPFSIGQPFVLEFRPYESKLYSGITIYINNIIFSYHPFKRLPLIGISQLQINGAIQLISITLCGNPPLPPPPLCEDSITFSDVDVPVNYDFEKIKFGTGFLPKKKITIIGTHSSDEYGLKDFTINMGESGVMGNNASIVFNLTAHFDKKQITRNSWTKENGWGFENGWGGFPLKDDLPFVLEISTKSNNIIDINVNYKYFTYFYDNKLTQVSQIEISKAIQVGSVIFCKKYN